MHDARESVRWEAARRERRARRTALIALVGSVILSLAAIAIVALVLVPVLNRQTEDVAQRTSALVGGRVVQDAREARVVTGRAELLKANARLAARNLPIVPDPGQDATGDELVIQAARANVLADLPESTIADLRRELGGATTLPSALTTDPVPPLGDSIVSLLPIVPSSGTPDGSPRTAVPPSRSGGSGGNGGSSPGTPAAPTSGAVPRPPSSSPSPAPSPAPRSPLLPLLPNFPLRIPLLSE